MKNDSKGVLLVGVIAVMVVLALLIPVLVNMVRNESKWGVKEQKNATAYSLAEAAVDRGKWKLMSSTSTWAAALANQTIPGYTFATTYRDIDGGSYRIRFSSGSFLGEPTVTIVGEGRDAAASQVRAVEGIFENVAFPGPVLSQGVLNSSGTFEAHWGPVMSQSNILLWGDATQKYYPRKFSKQVVSCTNPAHLRDTNGVTPPNVSPNPSRADWWSAYASVPDLPQLDFTTMKSSAIANGTYNYYNGSGGAHTMNAANGYSFGHSNTCGSSDASHSGHFLDSYHHSLADNNLIWFWDGDVKFTGDSSASSSHHTGLRGTIIVMGSLYVEDNNDSYDYNNGPVPQNAWKEYQTIDTNANDEYPADDGFQDNNLTFDHGSETWNNGPFPGPSSAYTDVGLRGLIYVHKDFAISTTSVADLSGVLWVKGRTDNFNTGERTLVFYERPAGIPVLNVVLQQDSWREVAPSTPTWAP